MKKFNFKFQEIHRIPDTFHYDVTKDSRNKTIVLGDMTESSNLTILLGFQSRTPMRVEKPGLRDLFNLVLETRRVVPLPSYQERREMEGI